MKFIFLCICFVVSIVFTRSSSFDDDFKFKYEYKYSFKGPYLSYRKGIPFWGHYYDAFPSDDKVRLVPSLKEKQGAVWSKHQFPHVNWQVNMSFRVTGKALMGADGFVLWYVETPAQSGNVFGSMDQWKGLAVIFDSFDNDNRKNNPTVSIFVNNGSFSFNHATDGFDQVGPGCMADFRNRPYPSKIKLIYINRQLQLYVDDGSNFIEEYELCASLNDIDLPPNYYFGLSAATGGLADDHDILKFLTWSVERNTEEAESEIETAETKKIIEEYEKNLESYNAEHEHFKEKYPEKVKPEYGNPEDLFQGSSSEEMTKVFEVQNAIKRYLNALAYTVDLIQGKQDAALRSLTEATPVHTEFAKSHQVQNAMTLQQLTHRQVQDFKNDLEGLKDAVLSLSSHVSHGASEDAAASINAGKLYKSNKNMLNIMENIHLIEEELTDLHELEKKSSLQRCPKAPEISCAPTTLFVCVAAAELLLLLVYFTWKNPSIDVGKKYF